MRWLILSFAAVPLFAAWAWLVFVATGNGWWREPLAPPGDASAFAAAAAELLDEESRGTAAFRLLDGARLAGEHYASSGAPVDADTLFQAASVSKWLTAWGVMTLVEAGKLELDAPVAAYLTRWQLPEGPFDNEEVTIRRLLSHTAGLTDGLGYQGFEWGTPVQPLTESLSRAADAMPGADGRVRVGVEPGSEWRYSGGGYALLQLVIEEVTGRPFEAHMRRAVLDPLGLDDSTFVPPEPEPGTGGSNAGTAGGASGLAPKLATSYDDRGVPAAYYRYAAPAAAGLYTTAADLTRFIQAQLPGPFGEAPGRDVLSPESLALMRAPHARAFGTEIWGLGQMLYADNGRGGYVVGHDGSNRPAANASVRFDPATGDGIVLLVTGNPGLAARLPGEWVFWHTGRLDVLSFYGAAGEMYFAVAVGWGVIVLGVIALGWLARDRGAAARR